MVPCFPRASCSSRLPSVVPSVASACFWLVVVFFTSFCGHLRPRRIFICIYFVASFAAAKWWQNAPPTLSAMVARLHRCPSHSRHQIRLVVVSPDLTFNSGHLKPRPHPPLSYFLSIYFDDQTDKTAHPHAFHPSCAPSLTPPPSLTPILYDCCVLICKTAATCKAQAAPPPSFF